MVTALQLGLLTAETLLISLPAFTLLNSLCTAQFTICNHKSKHLTLD